MIGRSTRHALSLLPALNRALLLDELRCYRLRGKFPHNHAAAHEPVPVFVDEHGTRCAVAHLLDISGQQQLVRKIARTQNYAKIHELAKHPALRAWLAAAGLTVVEAARIQPTYCYYVEAEACFCSEHAAADVSGLAVGTVQSLDQGALQVRIERIGGFFPGLTAGDIVAVQGRADAQQRVFVGRVRHEDGGVGPFTVVGERLSIVGDSVLCDYNAQTAARPVSLDTAMEAILPQSPCVGTLRVDDSAWNESTCGAEGGFGDDDGGGCSVAHVDSLGGPYIASAALFAALVAYRRLRRSTGRRPTERE